MIYLASLVPSVLLKLQQSEYVPIAEYCCFVQEVILIIGLYISELRPAAKENQALATKGKHIFKADE